MMIGSQTARDKLGSQKGKSPDHQLIPYLLTAFIGIVLVVCTFRLIGAVASAIVNWRRF